MSNRGAISFSFFIFLLLGGVYNSLHWANCANVKDPF